MPYTDEEELLRSRLLTRLQNRVETYWLRQEQSVVGINQDTHIRISDRYLRYHFPDIVAGSCGGKLRIEFGRDIHNGYVLTCNLEHTHLNGTEYQDYNGIWFFQDRDAQVELLYMGYLISAGRLTTGAEIRNYYEQHIISIETPQKFHKDRTTNWERQVHRTSGGHIEHTVQENPYWNNMRLDSVMNYHYHKNYGYVSDFTTQGMPTIGFELELNSPTASESVFVSIFNHHMKKHVFFEHDGSITGYGREDEVYYSHGVETISQPHTEDYLDNLPLESCFAELLDNNIHGSDSRLCGLHFHIGRSAFGTTTDIQLKNVSKVAMLIARNRVSFRKLFGRGNEGYCEWPSIWSFNETFDWVNYCNHCHAINIQSSKTFEFRFARATLKAKRFRAIYNTLLVLAKNSQQIEIDDFDLDKWFNGVKESTLDFYRDRQIFQDLSSL